METVSCFAVCALRIRASKSAIGSVTILPARFPDARKLTQQRLFSETETTHSEPSQDGPGTPTEGTAVITPHLEVRFSRSLHHQGCFRHSLPTSPETASPSA